MVTFQFLSGRFYHIILYGSVLVVFFFLLMFAHLMMMCLREVSRFVVPINGVIDVLPHGVHSSIYLDDQSISFLAARFSLIERKQQFAINRVSCCAD